MNKFLSMLVLLICTNLATMFAQNTTLEVDNQYPGWLSSKIPFKDQASVQNLTVTGYINGTDVKFIRELMNNRQLSHLDLSDANIVAGGDAYYIDKWRNDYKIVQDNVIGLYMFCGKLKYLSLPKSITYIETSRNTDDSFCDPIDTLIIGGNLKDIRYLDLYKANKYLEIREGVSSFYDYQLSHSIKYRIKARNVHLPSTIKELGEETFNTDTVKVNVENIDYFGYRCIFPGVLDIDTLTFSQDLSRWNVYAFRLKNGTTIFLNNKLKEISLKKKDPSVRFDPEGGALAAKNLIIHAPSREPINIEIEDLEIEDLLTTATVYVPKGCVEAYKNQLPWSNATILEEKIPVTGIKLDKDNISFSKIGETTFLNASILPEDASNKNVTWESSDTKVAIVSKGKVVCTGFETAVISAVSVNGDFMATCIINATTGIEGITDDAPQKVVKRYDITGREISQPINGINIVKTEDGRVLKTSVKRK